MKNDLARELKDAANTAARDYLETVLILNDYNLSKISREYNIDRANLKRKIKQLKIDVKKEIALLNTYIPF